MTPNTPRTDANVEKVYRGAEVTKYVRADFARQLERELNAALICAGVAAKERGEWAAERDSLLEEAALVCDREADRQAAYEGSVRDLGLKATHVAVASVLMAVAQRIRGLNTFALLGRRGEASKPDSSDGQLVTDAACIRIIAASVAEVGMPDSADQLRAIAGRLEIAANECGCAETYPQLVPGKVSHGPGCKE